MSCHGSHEDDDDDRNHDHDHPDYAGPQDNLFQYIDRANVVALNAGNGRGPEVIKPWHERNETTRSLVSEEDGELIIRVPFTGCVNLHTLLLKTGAAELNRVKVSLYPNDDNLDFNDVLQKKPIQEFDFSRGSSSIGAYPVMRAKFTNVSCITLYFHSEDSTDETEIFYVGFLGHWNQRKRSAVIAVYETQANLADHERIQGTDGALSSPQI